MQVIERIHQGKIPDTKPSSKRKVADFVEAIHLLRESAEQVASTNNSHDWFGVSDYLACYQHCSPSILIPKLVQIINYEEHLKKSYKDHEERCLNVEELMNFAAEMEILDATRGHETMETALSDDPME